MAITTNAICNSFKKELLQGKHDFDTSSDTYKLAMYTSSATLGASTENYATNPGGGSNTAVIVCVSVALADIVPLVVLPLGPDTNV